MGIELSKFCLLIAGYELKFPIRLCKSAFIFIGKYKLFLHFVLHETLSKWNMIIFLQTGKWYFVKMFSENDISLFKCWCIFHSFFAMNTYMFDILHFEAAVVLNTIKSIINTSTTCNVCRLVIVWKQYGLSKIKCQYTTRELNQ